MPKALHFVLKSPNVSTTPLRQWVFQQCLPFSWTTLKGNHCLHPIAVMGVVDTFEQNFLNYIIYFILGDQDPSWSIVCYVASYQGRALRCVLSSAQYQTTVRPAKQAMPFEIVILLKIVSDQKAGKMSRSTYPKKR